MSKKHKKLKEWTDAGLLTAQQAQNIQSYESSRRKSHFGERLVGLSIFAILVGILSIIASNWHQIPGDVKIGAHVLLNAGIGFGAWWANKKGRDIWREGATLAFLGLTFTLICLIGQVYQLDGSFAGAALLWLVITLPFFLLMGRSHMTAIPWTLAFLTTVWAVYADNVDKLSDPNGAIVTMVLWALLPLAMMAKGATSLSQRLRPVLADSFVMTGAALMLVSASVSLIVWGYGGETPDVPETAMMIKYGYLVFGAGLAGIFAHAVLYKFYAHHESMKTAAYFALVSLCACLLPVMFLAHSNKIGAALAFIAYWIFIGWLAQCTGRMRLLSLAITVIAIRIFVIYVELFGTLLDTGLGLIAGGVVMLALIGAARRINTALKGTSAHAA